MALTRQMEIANFVTTFGDKQVLLDFYDEIVEPAFFGGFARSYKDTTYLIVEPTIFVTEIGDSETPVIAGRFVKDTVLYQQQRLVDGQLEPADQTMDSAPSAMFALILKGHRLLYIREHRGAPTLEQFGTTLERFMKMARNQVIDERYKAGQEDAKKITRIHLQDAFPAPEVTIKPIATEGSVDAFFKRFARLRLMHIRLEPVNEEPDYEELFKDLRVQKAVVNAKTVDLEYRGTKEQGLDIKAASKQVKAALDGQASFKLSGTDHNGHKISGDNDEFQVRVPVAVAGEEVADAAGVMCEAFSDLVGEGAVNPGPTAKRHEAKLLGLIARLAGR